MLWYYKRLIDKYDVISFDVFDTLVERTCGEPEEIYKLVGRTVLGDKEAYVFAKQRIRAERKARINSLNGEVTIDDIYNNFEVYKDKLEILRTAEIKSEIDSCVARDKGKELWNYAHKKGKKVIVISDMYLAKNTIETIIEGCGYSDIANVFVSNECGCNKARGELYDYVKKVAGVKGNSIIHIGDSLKSDILGANGHFNKTIWLKKNHFVKHYLYRLFIKAVYR